MTRLQRQLIEFHRTFEHPIADSPSIPSDDRVRLRASLVVEECLEFVESLFDGNSRLLEGDMPRARDAVRTARENLSLLIANADVKVDLVEAADAMADIDYVVEGSRLEFGINGEPIADEVHRSNMSKSVVCSDCKGTAIRQKNDHDAEKCPGCAGRGRISLKRADGKTAKPAGWTPPDIKGMLLGQQAWPGTWGLRSVLNELSDEAAPTVTMVCDHGITFDEEVASTEKLDARQVRNRWPRLMGSCPKGCGFKGIYYASTAHFLYGDW